MKTAFVVAHPDDETLWSGGLIIRNPGATVICCSVPRRDAIRAEKFIEACFILGAEPRIIMQEEVGFEGFLPGINYLDLDEFDCIVTHNFFGEYGHPHHRQVFQHIKKTYNKKKIVTFGFREGQQRGRTKIILNDDEINQKLTALRCYNHTSAMDKLPKWEALLKKYGEQGYEIGVESYDGNKIGLSGL